MRPLAPSDRTPFNESYGVKTPQRKGRNNNHAVDILVTVLLPWLVFTLITCLFVFAYEEFAPLVWALLVASGLLAMLFIAMGGSAGRAWHLVLGFLILVALGIAVPVGLLVESGYMQEYWRLDNGAVYKQVNALDPSASHSDATLLEFREGTILDSKHSVGFMKAGTVYCAAPITTTRGEGTVQYWAVGINCCAQRGGFTCDDAGEREALSGLTMLDRDGSFGAAARMAESVYDLPPSKSTPLFVKWKSDATGFKDSLWMSAAVRVAAASVVHLVLCTFAGVIVIRCMSR